MVYTIHHPPGPYPVGATTFALSVDLANAAERIIGDAKVKGTAAGSPGEPALKLEEVAFTAFYPAKLDEKRRPSKGLSWLPKPVSGMLKGYAHFSNWYYWLVSWILHLPASWIKIPVYPNAALLDPQDVPEFEAAAWPLVIFTHGLAGNRTNYSHFCASLAAQGKMVLSLEHRDGTGPFVETISAIPGKRSSKNPDYKLYLHPEDVVWPDQRDKSTFPLRRDQLRFRELEIYLAYTHFQKFVASSLDKNANEIPCRELHTVDGPWSFDLDSRPDDREFWQSWFKTGSRPKVQCDSGVCLSGHSFGAATILNLLSLDPPTLAGEQFTSIPVTHTILLDPWLDPLPAPGPSPRAIAASLQGERDLPPPQMLVIPSEPFTLWTTHFERLTGVIQAWNSFKEDGSEDCADPPDPLSTSDADDKKPVTKFSGPRAYLITILRSQHIAFSDFGVLVPFGRYAREGRRFLSVTCDLAISFLQSDSAFKEELEKQTQVDGAIESVETTRTGEAGKKRYVGAAGDIYVH